MAASGTHETSERAQAFCRRFGVATPILLAPMAGACPPLLSAQVADAGGMGAMGALMSTPQAIRDWVKAFRDMSAGPFMINLWIPGAAPRRDGAHEEAVREFLARWGPRPDAAAADAVPIDFDSQCEAMLETRPTAISSIMGVFPPWVVERAKSLGVPWFATATTVREARVAEAAGADVIVAQGSEAGGHRGAFDPERAERELVGTFALVPSIVDQVSVPVIASGGIADGRGVAAALTLGAAAVEIGSAFLMCPEAGIAPSWARALGEAAPEESELTRAFSGRPGRALSTSYVRAARGDDAPRPAPYPVQRGLTAAMRAKGTAEDDLARIQAWAGQAAALAKVSGARAMTQALWRDAQVLLP
jgi:nitronate monooxygenase